jgi:hypothetical protein
MLQAIEERQRNLTDIGIASVSRIVFHDGNDLVVRFTTVRHAEAADGQGREENIAVRNRLLRKDADIEGITIPTTPGRLARAENKAATPSPQWVCGTSP